MDLIFKVVITAEFIALFSKDIAFSANCPNIQDDVPTFMNCQYRCHCKDDAQCVEQTGECTNGCDFGWMGPGCQYRNIVKNKWKFARQELKTQTRSDYAIKAVDGNTTTCSRTGNPNGTEKHYWYIPFHMTYDVLGIRIVVPPQDVEHFRNFRIETGSDGIEKHYPTLCYDHTNSSINTTMESMCSKSIKSTQLRIKLDEPGVSLRLCEVEIYGGRSVTFNEHSSQISTYKSPTFSWYASKAVDGKIPATASNDADRACAATGYSLNPWWRVDLETPYELCEIQFYGRLSHLHDFQGFHLQYSNSTDQFTELYHDSSFAGDIEAYQPMKIQINPRVTGKYWQFQFKKTNESLLVVCEVVAFAECPRNKCSENCSCSTEITGSYKIDGTCPHGCQGRWTGVDGKCDHECSQTQWGPKCQYKCGHCEGTQTCDVKTGYCKAGCSSPWAPPLCSKACAFGKYGQDCRQTCGKCRDKAGCNKESGHCSNGCQDNWYGVKCKLAVNLLYHLKENVTTTMSSVSNGLIPEYAINEWNGTRDPDTCQCCSKTMNAQLSWWKVDLQNMYLLKEIHVYGTDGDRVVNQLSGFSVYLANGSNEDATLVFTDTTSTDDDKGKYVIELSNHLARVVIIRRFGTIELCNVSLVEGECPSQTFGDHCNNACFCKHDTCTNDYGICSGECQAGFKGIHCNEEEKGGSGKIAAIAGGCSVAVLVFILTLVFIHRYRIYKREQYIKDNYVTPDRRTVQSNETVYDVIDADAGTNQRNPETPM